MTANVGLLSLGCDKNRVDSEIMLSKIAKEGYKIVNNEKDADIIIVNTCGFIQSAKEESIDTILEMAKNKENRCKGIIATGCLAERYKEELMELMPEINAVVGTGNYDTIADVIKQVLDGGHGIIKTGDIDRYIEADDRIITTPGHYAYLRIAEGCDNNCSYCIIPKLRGKFRSRPMENIIKEAGKLASAGTKELILVAQDTTMYGIDIYGKKSLHDLIKKLEEIDGIEWIRLLYTYPEEITDDLIEAIRNSKKVCKYLDMPMQHISDRILNKMRRKSSSNKIKELIEKLRNRIPGVVLRTTFITGFPGETEEDFLKLKSFIEDYRIDRVGIFTYSPEENTDAAVMEDQIDESIKQKRLNELMKIQSQISEENNKSLIGSVIEVIIDNVSNNGKIFGRSYGDAPEIDQQVIIENSNVNLNKGDIVKFKVKSAFTYDLIGDVYYEPGK